jgi:hypothetical protein
VDHQDAVLRGRVVLHELQDAFGMLFANWLACGGA